MHKSEPTLSKPFFSQRRVWTDLKTIPSTSPMSVLVRKAEDMLRYTTSSAITFHPYIRRTLNARLCRYTVALTSSTSTTSGSSSTSPSSGSSSPHKKSHAGAIAGGVVGGFLALLAGAVLIFWAGRRSSRRAAANGTAAPLSGASSSEYLVFFCSRLFSITPSKASPYMVPAEDASPTTKSISMASPSIAATQTMDYTRSMGSSSNVVSPVTIQSTNPPSTATQSILGHPTHGTWSASGVSDPPPRYGE